MNTLLGQRLGGKYELQTELGRGGMGIVYHAQDIMLRRSVAVKVLAPQLAADSSFVERFRHEAIAVANLRHPNIATVYDVGRDVVRGDTFHYLVMEFIDGQTLDRVLQRQGQPFSLQQTEEVIRQVAQALSYAHQRGMIHRDVKPANIMLGQDGHVTLMDFGLVRAGELSQLTQTGTALGTPAYMAPEQIMGAEVDRRTDVYALGVVTYELLTGDVPFRRTTPLATVHAQVYDPPPPLREKRPELSPLVESVVLRALTKNPGGRYRDVNGLATDFSRAITGQIPLDEEWNEQAALPGATVRAPAPQPLRAPSAAARTSAPVPRPLAAPLARRRRISSPWLWVAVTLAVLALGAGVLAAAGVFRSSTPDATVATTPSATLSPGQGAVSVIVPATLTTGAALGSQAEQEIPLDTATVAMFMATSTAIATSTPLPPTPTAPVAAQAEVVGDVLNLRNGPGTEYEIIGQVSRPKIYDVVGRDVSGAWWQVCCVNGDAGWVASNLVRVRGAVNAVVVVDVASPTPVSATNTPTAGPVTPTTPPAFTPMPTPAPTPCTSTVGPTFDRVWQRSLVGCPVTNETGVTSAYETFERGFMLWRKDDDGHYVVFDDGGFSRFIFPPAEPPEFACPEAAQLGRPQRGFSTVWCENFNLRQRIGNALDDEIGNDRLLQGFEQGFMVFIPERNAIYALLDDGSWRRFE
jgi:serine/threonine-protein kinase